MRHGNLHSQCRNTFRIALRYDSSYIVASAMARDLMTIRLDTAVRSRLRAVAARRGLSPSAALRLALDAWLAAEDTRAERRPYEELADLLGRVESRRRAAPRRMPARRGKARRGGAR